MFFLTKTVEIRWNWRCKIFSLKIRRCNFFDKFHVWTNVKTRFSQLKVFRKNKKQSKDTYVQKKRKKKEKQIKHLKGIFTMIWRNELEKLRSCQRFNFHWVHIQYSLDEQLESAKGLTYSAVLAICVLKSVFDFLFFTLFCWFTWTPCSTRNLKKQISVTNQNHHQDEGQGHHQSIVTWWPEHVLAWH